MLHCDSTYLPALRTLLARFGLSIVQQADNQVIIGSYWGESEAGLRGNTLYVRADTPLHSALHEACHYICMDAVRREQLDTDAGGEYGEENAVCYLQIILADYLPAVGRARLLADMDAWGYTFRLGSTRAWFECDAEDAKQWLLSHQLLDAALKPTWSVRK